MFQYQKEQETVKVGNVVIGLKGQPVLVGTGFHNPQATMEGTKEAVEKAKFLSRQTKIPFILDLFLKDEVEKRIDFADNLDVPFMIDGTAGEVRMKALRYCEETGLLDSCIYNSVNFGIKPEEEKVLYDVQPDVILALSYNPVDNSVAGKLKVFEDKLLPIVRKAKSKVIVDTAAMPIGNHAKDAVKSIPAFKAKFGFPTGNGIHNTSSTVKDASWELKSAFGSALISHSVLLGADFIMYGPVEHSEKVFPIVEIAKKLLNEGEE